MKESNQLQGTEPNGVVADVELQSATGPVRLSDFYQRRRLLLFIMCRFTCSRCWHGLLNLAAIREQLRQLGTVVLVVGDRSDLDAPTGLADEMAVPFPLLADYQHHLHHQFGSRTPDQHGGRVILVDECGQVRYEQPTTATAPWIDTNALLRNLPAPRPVAG